MTDSAIGAVRRPSLRRAALGGALSSLGRSGALIGMAALAVLMSLDEYGRFAHARGVLLLLAPLASCGFAVTTMRVLPQMRASGRAGAAAGHLALGYALTVPIGAAATGAAMLAGASGPAAAMLTAMPAMGGLFLGSQAARALDRPLWAYMPTGLATLAAAGLGGLAALRGELDAATAAWLFCLSAWTAAGLQAAALFSALPSPRFPAPVRWLSEAAPLTASLFARGWTVQGPFALLAFWATAETLGAYGLALTAAQALRTAASGINGAAIPSLSVSLGRGEAGAARRIARWSQAVSASAAAALAGLVFAAWLAAAAVSAPDRAAALSAGAAPLALLLAAAVLAALDAPLGQALVAVGRGRRETAIQCAAAAAGLVCALALIPTMGATGAAAATLVGAGLRLALLAGAARGGGWAAPAPAARGGGPNGADRGFSGLRAAIRADHERLAGPGHGPARVLRDALSHKTFRVVCSYRLYRALRRSRRGWARALMLPAGMWHRWTSLAIGAEIAWEAEIGPGLRILHGFGLVILPCAKIGANVTLAHGVCVGYRAAPERSREPLSLGVVEDGCFVGPFSFVWARMGRGSVLAPLSMLREDAPPGSVLVGAPARRVRGLDPDRGGPDGGGPADAD